MNITNQFKSLGYRDFDDVLRKKFNLKISIDVRAHFLIITSNSKYNKTLFLKLTYLTRKVSSKQL